MKTATLHLSREDRERLGNALMAYKASLSREAVTAPDLAEHNEIEASEVDDLAARLGVEDRDYFQPGYRGPKAKQAPRRRKGA